ncbi:MAG: ABC transporter substrate-binding protein [Acidimicrobiales bacterium]
MSKSALLRLLGVLAVLALLGAACGSDATEASDDEEGTATTVSAGIATTVAGSEEAPEEEPEDAMEEEVAAASGTLRYAEFSPVTTFDPTKAQTAQSVYLYPVYDTLTRQTNEFGLEPSLATSWEAPTADSWVFEIRDDVVFHDGEALTAQVVADNMNRAKATEGNPNGATWAGFIEATADGNTVTATFSVPQPQFPIEMSMVMGMMVSPAAMAAETDLTRNPQGSGPWIWQDGESEAGVTEVYTLFADYWNPADQGVERVEATAVPDNVARLNALLTGEVDIMGSIRDAQIDAAIEGGNEVISVPNYFPYMGIVAREEGTVDGDLLKTDLIRQAVAYAIDRDAYNQAIHAGKGDDKGGIYPSAFSEWHVPELDDTFTYDPDKSKELLAEAGFPDGITLKTPIMPAIQPHVELVTQMLGAVGISIDQTQINNGELGPRVRSGEWGLYWGRELLYHPAATYPKYTAEQGVWNPFRLTDLKDLDDLAAEAAAATDLATQQELYKELSSGLINRNVIIPLAHGSQNGAYAPNVTGVVMGLNMQAVMPYGVRVDG